jgi:murein DD-endopeptidase MepM/ murein hydrolase activator NlpD
VISTRLQPLRQALLVLISMLLGMGIASADEALIQLHNEPLQGALLFGTTSPGASLSLDGQLLQVDAEGRFVLGFGRDAKQTRLLHVRLKDGRQQQLVLQPRPRHYAIERIDGLPPATVNPPPEVSARISAEAQQVAIARAGSRRSSDWATPFIWPAKGRISGVYGSQRVLNGEPKRPHYGVDVAAAAGTPVVVPAPGLVVLAEADLYYSGGTIIIDHGDHVSSTFMHMQSLAVSTGQRLEQGAVIGTIGATGRATGAHLDWRMNWRNERVDPRLLLEPDAWQAAVE